MNFGSSGSTTSPQKVNVWNSQQKELWKTLAPILEKDIGSPVPSYPGDLSVPELGQESSYFSDVSDIQKSLAQARADISKPAYEINPQTTMDEFQKMYAQPESQQFENVVKPGINQSYAGPGYWGSARANAVSNAMQGLATTEGQQFGALEQKDIDAQRTAALQQQSLEGTAMPQIATAESGMMDTAGQYARSIAQQEIAADYLRWTSGETVDGVSPTQYNPFIQQIFEALGMNQFAIGTQGSSSGLNIGTGCCFIFIEANGGVLDPLVREFRDKLMTERNRRGYYRLSEKLVPWMKKSKLVRKAVEWMMIKPMMKSGRWHKEKEGFPVFSHLIGFSWMIIFDLLGMGGVYRRFNGEVI